MQDLGVKRVISEQKGHRAAATTALIQTATNEPDFPKKVITLKGSEASLSCVQCFFYLVSFSVNVSIFSYYMAGYLLESPGILHSFSL